MHQLEPYFNWKDRYLAESDERSPFFGRLHSQPAFKTIYNYCLHPEWDEFGSETLFAKLLFVDYDEGAAIIEFVGEWNDAIGNDIMFLWENVINPLLNSSIYKFILIGENILNFHGSEDDYYQAWFDELKENAGWIVGLNFRAHVIDEMDNYGLLSFLHLKNPFKSVVWRTHKPEILVEKIERTLCYALSSGVTLLQSVPKQ